MKKFFILFFFAVVAAGISNANAQTFHVNQTEKSIYGLATDNYNFYGKIEIFSDVSATTPLRWLRVEKTLPTGWSSSVCDKNACFPDALDSANLNLAANSTNYINIHFYPNGVSGTGTVKIRVFNTADPVESVLLTFTGITSMTSVGEHLTAGFTFFPNPTRDFLSVSTAVGNLSAAEIFDCSGKKVLGAKYDSNTASAKLDLQGLATGIYMLRMSDARGNETVQKFVKE